MGLLYLSYPIRSDAKTGDLPCPPWGLKRSAIMVVTWGRVDSTGGGSAELQAEVPSHLVKQAATK